MKPLKENYRELFENWNPFKNGRFVYQETVKPVDSVADTVAKEPEKAKEKPKITNEGADQQTKLSEEGTDKLKPSNLKEKKKVDERKTALKKSGENRDGKKAEEEGRHDQEGKVIEGKGKDLIANKKEGELEKKPAEPEKAKEVSELASDPKLQEKLASHLGLKTGELPGDLAQKMLAKMDQVKLKKLAEDKDPKAKLELSDSEAKAMGEIITGSIKELKGKEGKADKETMEKLKIISKALEGLSKEDAGKMGLKQIGEKLTMFLQLFKVLGEAMKTQDFTTLEEVMADITSKPPKNPADSMRESRDAYKKALTGIDPKTPVDDLLTAYFEPRGDAADKLFLGEKRYRSEAKTAIKDHLVTALGLNSITDIKKLESGITEITAYNKDGNKIAVELLIKPGETRAKVVDYVSQPKKVAGKETGETESVKSTKAKEFKTLSTVKQLNGYIATGDVTADESKKEA